MFSRMDAREDDREPPRLRHKPVIFEHEPPIKTFEHHIRNRKMTFEEMWQDMRAFLSVLGLCGLEALQEGISGQITQVDTNLAIQLVYDVYKWQGPLDTG